MPCPSPPHFMNLSTQMTADAQLHRPMSDPDSALTSDASASKKRVRCDTLDNTLQPITSTSGRPLLLSILHHHDSEIDAFLRFQMGKLRSGLEEARKRQCRAILTSIESDMKRKMDAKQLELEALKRRNAELEERVRHLASEVEIWFHVAHNSEAIVSGLRSRLEQALVTGCAGKEGSGETGDDAQSCCYAGEMRPVEPVAAQGTRCRACGDGETCVLVLPCRHLCLCVSCERGVDTCPVCRFPKNRSLRVFLS